MITKPSVKITFNSDTKTIWVWFRKNGITIGYGVYNDEDYYDIGYDSIRFVKSGGIVMPKTTVLMPSPPFNPWSLQPVKTDANTKDNVDEDEIEAKVI